MLAIGCQEGSSACAWERSVEVPVYASWTRDSLVFSARAPLAPHYEPDAASLHAVALIVPEHDY